MEINKWTKCLLSLNKQSHLGSYATLDSHNFEAADSFVYLEIKIKTKNNNSLEIPRNTIFANIC